MDKVLVLNADYTPLNITTLMRGFKLVYKGKAEVLKSSDTPISTGYQQYIRPLIIRLLKYVKHITRKIRVNRHKIYKRDGHECGYCGSSRDLTLDHIIPKSRGGQSTWTNMVTCCHKCNVKKGNRLPNEAGMTLRKKPYEPTLLSDANNEHIEKAWSEYSKSFGVLG